jgi:transposase-like protein
MSETKPAIDLLTLLDADETDGECRAYLEQLRWPNGVICPRCGGDTISRIKERKQFDCDKCRYQFSVMAGTIFHDSHLGLPKWFVAVYLLSESKNGMSANQLKRILKVSYKTAWYLCHRIRAAMTDAKSGPLTEALEMDETSIGRGRGRRSGKRDRHPRIRAALERGAPVRMSKAQREHRPREDRHQFIDPTMADEAASISTDDALADRGLQERTTRHAGESLFSVFNRSIVGSFHQISPKHSTAYRNEFKWRFTNQKNPYLFRDTLLKLIDAKPLSYGTLTA